MSQIVKIIKKAEILEKMKLAAQDKSKTVYLPAYMVSYGDIVILDPEDTLEKAWKCINHDLTQGSLVVEVELKGSDFF